MDCQTLPHQVWAMELKQISHTIFQNANFGVIVVDSSCKIKSINKAACDILAVSGTVVGESLSPALISVSGSDYEALLQAFSDNSLTQIEVRIKEEFKNLEICANKLLKPNGVKDGTVFLIYDVTSKQKDDKLVQDNLQLAAIGSLASEVAHELKNPVTVIKGFSQLLLKKQFADQQVVDFLEIIYKEAERAQLFIQDFLNLGKTKKLRKKQVCLPNLVSDSVAEIEKQCFLNAIEIVQQIEPSSKILGDYEQLKHALVNLGKNGVEAMEHTDAPKRLTFVLTKDSLTNTIYIKVIDCGCGISPQLHDKILTPFFTTKKYGTGLGLNITKTIVEQHGGKLTFFSSPQGTTATIELPMVSSGDVIIS
jgi:nitrogen-specific signal transduction histidine kinase